ncbi:aminopeptidase [Undibacterium sp. KW1]|uniref:alpha/beta hydrolase family protein n=1 Tax=Undibacterium sp. KW1 TaxID=2058624 RepID=UPI001331CAE5|nr:alpha/beta fold hydrolase [Undibacterium sp. KW1]BBB62360.1 aminopeptidase [Undibacterium sp. KW1]
MKIKTPRLLKFLLLLSLTAGFFNVHAQDLQAARAAYASQITKNIKAPQDFVQEKLPAGVKEIDYVSGKLHLKAWISALPDNAKKMPAVVFLHGGFSFSTDDWVAAQGFVNAGYLLLMPRLRGENGGEGYFEMFGGEVDDAIAAGKYLASLPQVDTQKIYLAGHSIGGSMALLVSQMPSPYKAVAAYSGFARLPLWLAHYKNIAPFNVDLPDEQKIRDPYRYVASVKTPLYVFTESASPPAIPVNTEFCNMVAKYSICKHEVITGSHESMIAPAVARTIALFNKS